jgi:hypothetical protein
MIIVLACRGSCPVFRESLTESKFIKVSAHLKRRIGPENATRAAIMSVRSMHVRMLHRARSRKRNPGECLDYHSSLYPAPSVAHHVRLERELELL